MNKVFQTDSRLNAEINKSGCYFRTMLSIAERMTGKLLSAQKILQAYDELIHQGSMKENCWLRNPEAVTNLAFVMLGSPESRCYQIGIKDKGKEPVFWRWVKDTSYQATAINGLTGLGNDHWVEGDDEGEEIWNPYPGAKLMDIKRTVLYKVM